MSPPSPPEPGARRPEIAGSVDGDSTPCRRKLRSDRTVMEGTPIGCPIVRKFPRQDISSSSNTPPTGGIEEDTGAILKSCQSPVKRLSYKFAVNESNDTRTPEMNSKEFWSYEEAVWSMRMQIAYTYVDAHGLASPCLWRK